MWLICAIFEGASLGCIIFASFFRRHNALNAKLPAYSRISICEMRVEPFEKTPKLSIKRFMYN